MNYCSNCGHTLTRQIPPGDQHERDCCLQCGTIHYVNPKIVVGTLPIWNQHILLCRRAIEPRRGYWTLPAGFLECRESTSAGALRETWEEAGATVTLGPLLAMIDIPHIDQVHLFFQARLPEPMFAAGTESLEVALFLPENLPWDELAFRSVRMTLEHYLQHNQIQHNQRATALDIPLLLHTLTPE